MCDDGDGDGGVSMCVKLNIAQFTVLFIGLLFGCLTFIGKVFRNNSGSMYVSVCLVSLYRSTLPPALHLPQILIVLIISTSNCRERNGIIFYAHFFS